MMKEVMHSILCYGGLSVAWTGVCVSWFIDPQGNYITVIGLLMGLTSIAWSLKKISNKKGK